MDREPDAGGLGAGMDDPVASVGGDEEIIAGVKVGGGVVVEEEGGLTLKKEHPLVPVLVVPLSVRGGMPFGEDSFHFQAGSREKGFEEFLSVWRGGKLVGEMEEIGSHRSRAHGEEISVNGKRAERQGKASLQVRGGRDLMVRECRFLGK